MLLGSIDYKICGDGFARLYKVLISEKIPARNMREKNGDLFLKLSAEYCRRFESICDEVGCQHEIIKINGMLKLWQFIKKRPGLVAGLVISCALSAYYSNVVLRLDVLTDNEVIRKKVMDVLETEGITAGTYIPDIDYAVAERALKKHIDEISWAGISRDGNGLIIDVVENIPKPDGIKTVLPSNLVACENGVIEELDILDGQVRLCVGSGVTKGDVIVSGEVVTVTSDWSSGQEVITTDIDYTRSIGTVYGTFERKMVFEQPFEERVEVSAGREETVRYINFFSAQIPLFKDMPKGYFASKENTSYPEIVGMKLPIGITIVNLSEYDFRTEYYTKDEAAALAGEKAYKYEQNFLKDYEIKDRQCKTEVTEDGVKQIVTYTLYGAMSKETEFFIPK